MHVQGSPGNFQLADSYSGSFLCADEASGSKSSPCLWARLDLNGTPPSPSSVLHPSGECAGQASVASPAKGSEQLDFATSLLSKSGFNAESNSKTMFDLKKNNPIDSDAMQSQKENRNTCEGCRELITDFPQYFIDGKLWHEKCKSCSSCGEVLDSFCFLHRGKLYCKKDYLILRMRCDGCGQSIGKEELTVASYNKAHRYVHHVHCCICVTCKRLIRGEECHFYLSDQALVILQCNSCWEEQQKQTSFESHCIMSTSPLLSSDETDYPQKSPSLLTPKSTCDDDNILSSEEESFMEASSLKSDKEIQKNRTAMDLKDKKGSKRPRTILTGSQRNVFKSVFETTQKPNKKQREDLARNTGLTARVVQVWFQNQRAKIKKLSKRQQVHEPPGLPPPEMLAFHGFDPSLKLSPVPPVTDFVAVSQYEELRRLQHPHLLIRDVNYHTGQAEKWNQRRQDVTQYCFPLPYTCTIQELTSSSEARFTGRFNPSSSDGMTQDLRNASESLQSNFHHGEIPDYSENMFKSTRRDCTTEGSREGFPSQPNLIHSGMDIEPTGSDACLMQNTFFS